MAMAFLHRLKTARGALRWSGGGLLLLLSLGLHGLLLGLPLPQSESPALAPLPEQPDPDAVDAVIDVVRLPTGTPPRVEATPATPAPLLDQGPAPDRPPEVVATAPAAPPDAAIAAALPEPQTPEPQTPEPPTLDARLGDPAEYQFNDQVKSLIADQVSLFTGALPDWLEAEGRGLSEDEAPIMGTKLAPLRVAYPLTTCLVPPPAEGLVGVIVNSAGQLVKAPVLLDSTGYSVLDDKALDMAAQRIFEPSASPSPANPHAHWLPVQVQYDLADCSS